jgi:hypothetical protein
MRATQHESTRESRLARMWSRARVWASDGVVRLREEADGRSPPALAAAGVRAVTVVLEVATGPFASAVLALGSEVVVLAIATGAVKRTLADAGNETDSRAVLAAVIDELARAEACEVHMAAAWRGACGAADGEGVAGAMASGIRRVAAQALMSRAIAAAARKAGLKKLLWIGSVVSLAKLPGELRRVYTLVERAEHIARSVATSRSVEPSAPRAFEAS